MPSKRPASRLRVRLLALGVGVFAAAGVMEVAMRVLDLPKRAQEFVVDHGALPDVFVEDPDTFWRLAEDNGVFAANRLGLRGPAPSAKKPEGSLRVVCVGDSSTLGYGHRYEQAYGALLGRALQRGLPNRRVDTLLAALPAFSSYQDRVLFERDIVGLQPDVSIFYCGAWNDGMAAVGLSDSARAERRRSRAANPLFSLRIVQAAAEALDPSGVEGDVESYLAERPDGARVPEPEFRANLEAMIDQARSIGSLVVVIVPPHAAEFAQNPRAVRYRELAREAAAAKDVLLVDAPKLLRDAPDNPGGPWFDDLIHPSVAGHRKLAEALFARLKGPVAERLSGDADSPGSAAPRLDTATFELFSETSLRVTGEGVGPDDQVWIGEDWLPGRAVSGGLEVDPKSLRGVGSFPVEVVTDAGLVIADVPLEVTRPRPKVRDRAADGSITVAGMGPPGWLVGLWCSSSLRTEAAATPYGPFKLQDGSPEPLSIDKISLEHHLVTIGEDGRWQIELPSGAASSGDRAQALWLNPEDLSQGVMSVVVDL